MERLEIRKATDADIPAIYDIIKKAQGFLKARGVNQWQNNYPNEDTIISDISKELNYVCCYEDKVIGTIVIIFDGEITYNKIYDGEWLSDGEYVTIHRLAVDDSVRGQGIAARMIYFTEQMCKDRGVASIRIDTHRDNIPMQRTLSKYGFVYCGIIYLANGDERLAFEKILT